MEKKGEMNQGEIVHIGLITEDDIPVRTLYIPNVTIHVTHQTLCNYFRQYGAIERVQILPERLKLTDLIPPLDEQRFLDPSKFKHFAYITFVNNLGAELALNVRNHEVNGDHLTIQQAFSWHQPHFEHVVLPTPNASASQEIVAIKTELFKSIDDKLNDDVINYLMSFLNLFELIDMADYNVRFAQIAQQQRAIQILPNLASQQLTLLHLRQILRLHGFGYSALDVTISLRAFKCDHYHACDDMIDKMIQYIGPQLRSLSLISFNIRSAQFAKLKPLLLNLVHLEIDVNYDDFDYEQFNDVWPNLKTLRIQSAGSIHVVKRNSLKDTAFPKLTTLIILSRYKLYEHLFENIANTFKNLKELVLICIGDYYTELNVTIPTDIDHITRIERLKKLHLSFGQNYLNDNIWKTLGRMTRLEHFTIEVTNQRNDTRANVTDANLTTLRKGMWNLIEFRISGFNLVQEKVLDIIRSATNLDYLCIFNSGLEFTQGFLKDISSARMAQLSRREDRQQTVSTSMPSTSAASTANEPKLNDTFLHLTVEPNYGPKMARDMDVIPCQSIKSYLDVKIEQNRNTFSEFYGINHVLRNAQRRVHRFERLPESTRDPNRPRNRLFFFHQW